MQKPQNGMVGGFVFGGALLGLALSFSPPSFAQTVPPQNSAQPSPAQASSDGTEGLGPTETTCTTRATTTQAPPVGAEVSRGQPTPGTQPTSSPQPRPARSRSGSAGPRR